MSDGIQNTLCASRARFLDYWELTKPRPVSLVLLSTLVGFLLATDVPVNFIAMFLALASTSLVAAGAMTLNQWAEREFDGCMARTANRPLPSGRLQPIEALAFGVLLTGGGILISYFGLNGTSTLLSVLTSAIYLFLYTPLKRKTSLCTIVGAVPGALPPLIGWAATGEMPSFTAWLLFVIIFLWQMPHFLAIAWMYRHEYANARFSVLSVENPDGRQVANQIVIYALALLPVSLMPTVFGVTGSFYFLGALVLGVGFAALAVAGINRLDATAKPLFKTSIIHLAALLILMVVDRV